MTNLPDSIIPKRFSIPKIVKRFLNMEASGGIVLIIATALALFSANSFLHDSYKDFINIPVMFGFSENSATEPLKTWVKDILMVLFFLLIGLELKREAVSGFLSQKDQIILPMLAAIGGMLAPAAIFLLFNYEHPENWHGWAIPSATDIAFALGILMLIGRGVPPALKIFLLAIAIFDDIGAILIIALFYSGALNLSALGLAVIGVLALFILNRMRIGMITPYIVVGIYLWFCFHISGIHATIAGVLVGLFIPMKAGKNNEKSPVNKAIHFLHPWVAFVILPIFAFTSAGVSFAGLTLQHLLNPIPIGIALSLFFGKQIGIFGTTWIAIKCNLAKLPDSTSWLHVYGVSALAGIGFTMSLFIGILAFPESVQDEIKIGVITGSVLSAILGFIILSMTKKNSDDNSLKDSINEKN
ncbi:MAG: Na+/H+ antiporter NhaA [Rickettsiales bacterium]